MKRPLPLIGITFLVSAVFANIIGDYSSLLIGITTLILGLTLTFVRRLRINIVISTAILTLSAALISFSFFSFMSVRPLENLPEKAVRVAAVIIEPPEIVGNSYRYAIETSFIDSPDYPQKVRAMLYTDVPLKAEPFDVISADMKLKLPPDSSGTSSRKYYLSQGIMLSGHASGSIDITKSKTKPPYFYALKIRQHSINMLNRLLGKDSAGILISLVTGDRSYMSDEIYSNFKAAGVSHTIAVSGMHTAVIAAFIMFVLSKFRLGGRVKSLIVILFILLFMAITGFPASVVRAGAMIIICYLAPFFKRDPDTLSSLGFAALVIVVPNPFAAMDIGLLLSFSATLGIVLLSKKIKAKLCRFLPPNRFAAAALEFTYETAAMTVAATLFTLPITVIVFGYISLIAVPANIVIAFPVAAAIILGVITLLVSPAPLDFVVRGAAFTAGIFVRFTDAAVSWFASLPFAVLSATEGWVLLWLAMTLILAATAIFMTKSARHLKLSVILSAIIFMSGFTGGIRATSEFTTVTVTDVGDGLSLIVGRNGRAVLIGCGGNYSAGYTTRFTLESMGIKTVECLILPDMSKHYTSGLNDLLKYISPAVIVMPEDSLARDKISAACRSDVKFETYSDVTVRLNPIADIIIEASYLIIKAGDTEIVLLTNGGSVPENLAGKVVVTTGGSVSGSDNVIVSQGINSYFSADGYLSTAEFGTINVFTKGKNDILVRRNPF